jgi:hypothetical protein
VKNYIDSAKLVGFDIRLELEASASRWNEERRSKFLLRDDIRRPLSVDQNVWSSAFPDANDSEQWRGVLGHWSDLTAMSGHACARGIVGCLVSTVIIWDLLTSAERHGWATGRLDGTTPTKLGPEWRIIGYDIADRWLVSGLSNCGYIGSERAEWRSRWSDRVNEAHLFDDPDEASRFAKATDERVPEHAPFFVYGLLVR